VFKNGTGRGGDPILPSRHKSGEQFRSEYQKMHDEGIQIALKYLGE